MLKNRTYKSYPVFVSLKYLSLILLIFHYSREVIIFSKIRCVLK